MTNTNQENQQGSSLWSKVLKIVITVLSAIAAAFGLQACGIV